MSRSIWFVPRKALNTSAIADVIAPCAAGYSGWLGVVRSGRQPVCSTVAGLPRSEEHTSELQSMPHRDLPSFPTRRSSDLIADVIAPCAAGYSGWLGVVRSGRQPVCSTVAGLP